MKRRPKPNRQGGRAHGGGGNQGQNQIGRKGGNSAFGHEDLELLEDEPIESEDESDDEWVMEDEDEEQSTVSKNLQKMCKFLGRQYGLLKGQNLIFLEKKNRYQGWRRP